MTFRYLDLFAGIGGFHAVMSGLGGVLEMAVEIDDRARDTYERNWGVRPERDVVEVANQGLERVGDHELLAGGFPCQPFSKSGKQLGMGELRGQLFNEVLKILEARRPAVVMLENVRNIAGPRQRETWKAIILGLREAGYLVASQPLVFSPHLLSPEMGGAPQTRDRVYILGTYVGRERAMREDPLPVLLRKPVDGWDPARWRLDTHLVREREVPAGPYRLTDDELTWIAKWNHLLGMLGEVQMPGFPMWSTYWHDGAEVDSEAPAWKQRFEAQNIGFYREHRRVINQWFRTGPDVRSFPASRQKLEWQAGSRTPRDLNTCLLHLRPSGIRVKAPHYAPALVAMAQTPVYGPLQRRLTVPEAAALQGFDRSFDFGDQALTATFKQLGNAINVGTARYVLCRYVEANAADIQAAGGKGIVDACRDSVRTTPPRGAHQMVAV